MCAECGGVMISRPAEVSAPVQPPTAQTSPSQQLAKKNPKLLLFAVGVLASLVAIVLVIRWTFIPNHEPSEPPANVPRSNPVSTGGTASSSMPPNAPAALRSFNFLTATYDGSGNLRSRDPKSASEYEEDLGSGVKLEMVAVPPGEFLMGSPESEADRSDNEGPQHRVQIR